MTTIDESEVRKFSEIADDWWNENGEFKMLHKFNPCRIKYIKEKILENFDDLSKVEILDIGCGGGLISEAFAKFGCKVSAIDASFENIEIAKKRLCAGVDYKQSSIEDFAISSKKFDAVFALEIIEHISDIDEFIKCAASLLKENGVFFIATINRNIKSFLFAKIAAEYVFRWLKPGTHNFKKFLKPSEIYKICDKNNLRLIEQSGFKYNIFNGEFSVDKNDLSINFISVYGGGVKK